MRIKKYENGFLNTPEAQKTRTNIKKIQRYDFFDMEFLSDHIKKIVYGNPVLSTGGGVKQKFTVELEGLERNPTFVEDFFISKVGREIRQTSFFQTIPENGKENSSLHADIWKVYNYYSKESELPGANEYGVSDIYTIKEESISLGKFNTNLKLIPQYQKLQKLQPLENPKHFIFTPDTPEFLKDRHDIRWMFPVFADIVFNTEVPLELSIFLKNSKTLDDVMKIGLYSEINSHVRYKSLIDFEGIERLESIDLKKFIDDAFSSGDVGEFTSDFQSKFKIIGKENTSLMNMMSLMLIKAKIQSLIENNKRTIEEIHEGRTAYSEILFYEIAKHEVLDDLTHKAEPIQITMLPNSEGFDLIKYADTQVKYDKRYIYKIYAWKAVIGSKAVYNSIDNLRENSITVSTTVTPTFDMFRVPYYEERVLILDNPPIYPDVTFNSYKEFSDRILISMNENFGEVLAKPIPIGDESDWSKVRESQELTNDGLVKFKGEEFSPIFEVFRLSTKPTSYNSFVGNRTKLINTKKGTTFVDFVDKNKKYYYIFRAIDHHKMKSNPTYIFEVELHNLEGFNFLEVNAITESELEILKDKRVDKNVQKYIQIMPTLEQSIVSFDINEATSAYDIEQKLGVKSNSVFGKKFKIRLTSKKTNKKIDLNVIFNHEKII